MDSANSGSLQSSSGGDEEYESNPGFFNPNFPRLSNPQNPFPLFDPNNSQNFFQTFSQSSQNPSFGSSQLNLSGKQPENPLQIGSNQALAAPSTNPRPTAGGSGGSSQAPGVVKNPKKRTRASRRAPTTVLTTDTSNFRAMVQEFTGIPAPPFSASPYSRRLDLFGSGLRSNLDPISTSGLYPLRPSAQKINQSPILFSNSSSSSNSPLMNNNLTDSSNKTGDFNGGSVNFQLSSEPQNLLNLQNQMFSFESLLPSSSSVLQPSFSVPLKSQFPLSSVGELGSGQGRVNGDFISHGNNNSDQDQLRSIDGCKVNISASDFQHQKGLENVPPRGEGTVDSWICPSD